MDPNKGMRIGTRSSPLALYQAKQVARLLNQTFGTPCNIIPFSSHGDEDLIQPIYQMGITGVFTKALDQALLEYRIDVAVHSLKDIPTQLAEDISLFGVIKRGNPYDVVLHKHGLPPVDASDPMIIGTGSPRRSAFWKLRHPHHETEGLRGNIQTRLKKLESHRHWEGAIFAQAAIERLKIERYNQTILDWMTPAAGQGAIAVCGLSTDATHQFMIDIISDKDTALCTGVERDFMKTIGGGCSQPIGAFAELTYGDRLRFQWSVFSPDGKDHINNEVVVDRDQTSIGKEEAIRYLRSRL